MSSGSAIARQVRVGDLVDLPSANIVIVGEIHDNPVHHENQAAAVAALKPAAIVFEMLSPTQAARATPDARLSSSALSAALDWEGSGWPAFDLYYPIFVAAPDAKIFGAALPGSQVARALDEGAAAVFGEGAAEFGLTTPLPADDLAARREDQGVSHCGKLPQEMLGGMVEAQRLRDAAFARAAIAAHLVTGGPVVVITGTGHARRDWGMPVALAAAAPDLSVLSIGQFEGPPGGEPAYAELPYDLWLVTGAVERPDPCLAFE